MARLAVRWRLASARERGPGSVRALLSNTASLLGTTAVTAGLGIVYWWLAARHFSQSAVGFASAGVSAMTLLGTLATFGFTTLLIGELTRPDAAVRALMKACLLATSVAGILFGVVYGFGEPIFVHNHGPLYAGPVPVLLFALGVSLTGATQVLDQAAIGLFRGGLQLWRNSVLATTKLVVLAVLGLSLLHPSAVAIYASWVVGLAVSLLTLVPFFRSLWSRTGEPRTRVVTTVRRLAPAAASHHALNLALKVPVLMLPVLVVALVSARSNAAFYIAWTIIINFALIVPNSITTVLYAVGAAEPRLLARRVQLTVGISVGAAIVAIVVVFVAGSSILHLFGGAYASEASTPLRILSLGAVPVVVRSHFIAISRITDRVRPVLSWIWIGTVLELAVPGAVARSGGLAGLSAAWVLVVCLEATFMAPNVYATMRGAPRPTGHANSLRRAALRRLGNQLAGVRPKAVPNDAE